MDGTFADDAGGESASASVSAAEEDVNDVGGGNPDGGIEPGMHAPPRGAIESARKFLWEDESVQSRGGAGGPGPPSRGIDWSRPTFNAPSSRGRDDVQFPDDRRHDPLRSTGVAFDPSSVVVATSASRRTSEERRGSGLSASIQKIGQTLRGSFGSRQGPGGGVGTTKNTTKLETIDLRHDTNICPRQNSFTHLDEESFRDDPAAARDRDGEGRVTVDRLRRWLGTMRARNSRIVCLYVLLTIAAVVVSTFHLVDRLGSSDSSSSPSSLSSSATTTTSENGGDEEDDGLDYLRLGEIKQRIIDEGLSTETELNEPNSPRREGMLWLSHRDGARMDPEDDRLPERYALAVLFYSTHDGPDGWVDSFDWLSSRGYCLWKGIRCHHRGGSDVYDGNGGITHLNLTENDLRGTLPKELVLGLSDIRVLDLGRNRLRGTIPEEISALSALETLYLSSNYLSGTIPDSIGEMSKLTHVFLSDSMLEGPIPATIGNLKSLNHLDLHRNYLNGTVPPEICDLPELFELYLDDNDLTGVLPPELGQLTSASDVRLSLNNFTGTIPPNISALENVELLYLDRNKLTGTLPPQLSRLMRLDELQIYGNELTGTVPSELALLNDLNLLYLDHNKLSGTIPESLFRGMTDIEHMYLNANNFSGPIPTTVGNMKNIKSFRLYDNRLTGSIPTETGSLSKLEKIYLNDNKLKGALPYELGMLHSLEKLIVNGNDITGSVPASICSLRETKNLKEFHSDCGGDPPQLECHCCTQCFD